MERAALDRKIQTALDETRLLLLGAQILLGFQFSGTFVELFDTLDPLQRHLHALALLFMVAATAFLIAPTMYHRIVERGACDERILAFAGQVVAIALVPFALSLGIDHFTVFSHLFGVRAGVIAGVVFFLAAILFWFVLALAVRRPSQDKVKPMMSQNIDRSELPLVDRVTHMLTEARVVLPGAQALLGFQLSVVLMRAFTDLPEEYKILHAAAMGCVALSVILLIAPAAFHRIGFGGTETEEFYRIGSRFVIAATVPLAIGVTADMFVAVAAATESSRIGATFAAVTGLILVTLWYVQPIAIRYSRRRETD